MMTDRDSLFRDEYRESLSAEERKLYDRTISASMEGHQHGTGGAREAALKFAVPIEKWNSPVVAKAIQNGIDRSERMHKSIRELSEKLPVKLSESLKESASLYFKKQSLLRGDNSAIEQGRTPSPEESEAYRTATKIDLENARGRYAD